MDILHTGRFDGFVLVSSDSDFTRLASRIREEGLDVIGIGERKAPEALRNVCNRFILIENLIEDLEPTQGTPQAPFIGKTNPSKALPLILKAMDKMNIEDEWYNLGTVGQFIMADNPDFDTRTYGEKKLSDLIRKLKQFDTHQDGNRLKLRRVN